MATGAVQYVLTGASYDTAVAIVSGGSWGEDANVATREGIGGVGVIVPGLQMYRASFDVVPVDANCLLDKVLRASYPAGALTAVQLELGDDELGIQDGGWLVDACEFAMSVEEPLSISYDVVTPSKVTKTSGAGEVGFPGYIPGDTTVEWYNGDVTIGGSSYDCRAITGRVRNNLMPRPTLDTKTSGSRRYPEALDVGPEEVELTAEFWASPDHDLNGDDLATATIQVQGQTSAASPKTITLAATTTKVVNWETSFVDAREQKVYTVSYRLDANSGDFSIAIT